MALASKRIQRSVQAARNRNEKERMRGSIRLSNSCSFHRVGPLTNVNSNTFLIPSTLIPVQNFVHYTISNERNSEQKGRRQLQDCSTDYFRMDP